MFNPLLVRYSSLICLPGLLAAFPFTASTPVLLRYTLRCFQDLLMWPLWPGCAFSPWLLSFQNKIQYHFLHNWFDSSVSPVAFTFVCMCISQFPFARCYSTFFENYCPPKNLFWTDPHLPPTVPFPHEILIPTIYSMFVYSLCALCFVHKIEQDFSTRRSTDFYPFRGNNTPVENACCSTISDSITYFVGICWIN